MSIGGIGGLGGLPGVGAQSGNVGGMPGNDLGGMGGAQSGGSGGFESLITPNASATGTQGDSFSSALGDMVLYKPSASHAQASDMAARLAAGENIDPHQVAISTAKAGVEIQMATRTISQTVSAVRTLFQMQV